MNRYVKVVGHNNWFLVLTKDDVIPTGLSETMQERVLRSEVSSLHDPNISPSRDLDIIHRITLAAVHTLDYEKLVMECGSILVRPIGSFMLLNHNEIIQETFDIDFPIEEYGEIVICENDCVAEYKWVKYLEKRFPNTKIVTINFFDLRSENDIVKYFSKAKYVTFSTTFTNLNWYEKLTKFADYRHTIIGYCEDEENVRKAMLINDNVEMVGHLK